MKTLAWLAISMLAYGCTNRCDRAQATSEARYEDCGLDVSGGTPTYECTEEVARFSQCNAACIRGADCGVLDGTNVDYTGPEWTAYTDCLAGCS